MIASGNNSTRINKKASLPLSTVLLLAVLLIVTSACSEGGGEYVISGDDGGMAMPQALQRATFPDSGTVSAFITVDRDQGGGRQAMTINGNTASFSGKVDAGTHDFFLEILYESAEFSSPLTLVEAELENVTVSDSSATTINFTEANYQYIDSDGDAWTNVREIETGSNPTIRSEVPADRDDNYEDNDSTATAYDITGLRGIDINTNLSTGQGLITTSDPADFFKVTLPTAASSITAEFLLTTGTLGGLLYLNENNEFVAGTSREFDTGDPDNRNFVWTFTNPEPRDYYLFTFTEDLENPVPGAYFMKWDYTE